MTYKFNRAMKRVLKKHNIETMRYKFSIDNFTLSFAAPAIKNKNELRAILFDVCEMLDDGR